MFEAKQWQGFWVAVDERGEIRKSFGMTRAAKDHAEIYVQKMNRNLEIIGANKDIRARAIEQEANAAWKGTLCHRL